MYHQRKRRRCRFVLTPSAMVDFPRAGLDGIPSSHRRDPAQWSSADVTITLTKYGIGINSSRVMIIRVVWTTPIESHQTGDFGVREHLGFAPSYAVGPLTVRLSQEINAP
eukprot:scaffold16707_cov182-Amphora_coffeaeformis.AAC.3